MAATVDSGEADLGLNHSEPNEKSDADTLAYSVADLVDAYVWHQFTVYGAELPFGSYWKRRYLALAEAFGADLDTKPDPGVRIHTPGWLKEFERSGLRAEFYQGLARIQRPSDRHSAEHLMPLFRDLVAQIGSSRRSLNSFGTETGNPLEDLAPKLTWLEIVFRREFDLRIHRIENELVLARFNFLVELACAMWALHRAATISESDLRDHGFDPDEKMPFQDEWEIEMY